MEIKVEHITRVEGHGNIVASLQGGRVEQAFFQVVEAIRFFEGFLRGKSWREVSHLASRICGICAISHSTASLQATEQALGLALSPQAQLLRRLIMNAEILSSHALHVYFLAAPDFLGLKSVMPLIETGPEVVARAFRLKKTGYELAEVVVGRHTHPVAAVPGGFTMAPEESALRAVRDKLTALRPDLEATVELWKTLEVPEFSRPTEYVCLRRPEYYAFEGGEIVSSEGDSVPVARYGEAIEEHVVSHSTAKHARWHRESYLVGALARVNNNWRQLHPAARRAMEAIGLQPPCHNTFMNTAAQVVEIVHCVEDSIALIDEILSLPLQEEWEPEVTARAGEGVGAAEAPRGLLIHDYTYDEQGRCVRANCVIPTNQNLANLDADMRALLPQLSARTQEEVQLRLEMLVRSYDPCISCSVH